MKAKNRIPDPIKSLPENPNKIQKILLEPFDPQKLSSAKAKLEDDILGGKNKREKVETILKNPDLLEFANMKVLVDQMSPSTTATYSSEAKLYE